MLGAQHDEALPFADARVVAPKRSKRRCTLFQIRAALSLSMSWKLCGPAPQWTVTALAASTPDQR